MEHDEQQPEHEQRPSAWRTTPSAWRSTPSSSASGSSDIESDWEQKEQDPAVPGARPDRTRGASESPGVPGEEETGTGNPDNAGADE